MNGDPFLAIPDEIESPWVQGLLIAIGTIVMEDPTTIGAGLLVADGKMAWQTAFFGLWFGIVVGDMLLYSVGRVLGPGVVALRLLRPDRVERARRWFDGNLFVAVAGTRFIPGMRTPVYMAAGVFRAHPLRFLGIAIGATMVWTVLLLYITIQIGQEVLPLLGRWRWPLAIGAIVAIILSQWLYRRRQPKEPVAAADDEAPVVSVFEFWPRWLFHLPVALHCLALGLRHRSLTLPAAANPALPLGGLAPVSKAAILDLAGPEDRAWIAPYVAVDLPEGGPDPGAVEAAARGAGFGYPMVVKPDAGQRGAGVRPVADRDALAACLGAYPAGARVVVQARAAGAREMAVLWARRPGAASGTILSAAEKLFPTLTGDGRRTVRELLQADVRACLLFDQYAARLGARMDETPEAGAAVALVFPGEHAQGAMCRDARGGVTAALRGRIEGIAAGIPDFHYGRFDLRFDDPAALARGEGFQIVSIAGAGAEPPHIWDPHTRLRDAYAAVFAQWRLLFEIGAAMRARGHRPPGVAALARAWRAANRLARAWPPAS